MTIFYEPRLPLEALISELPGYISRDIVTVAMGSSAGFPNGTIPPCTVLGKVGIAGTVVSAVKASGANTVNSGTLTVDAVTPLLPFAMTGLYKVRCIAAAAGGGTFRVTDVKGAVLDDVAVGATFADRIKFVIAPGSADFVKGDGFDVVVEVTGGAKFIPAPATSIDGSDVAAAINLQPINPTLGDVQVAVINTSAEFTASMMSYDPSVNTPALIAAKTVQLAALGIKLR